MSGEDHDDDDEDPEYMAILGQRVKFQHAFKALVRQFMPKYPEPQSLDEELLMLMQESTSCYSPFVWSDYKKPDSSKGETMQDFQQRVVDEKTELDSKLTKLTDFIATNPIFVQLPKDEQLRLERQHVAMQTYSDVLGERIAAFS